MAISYSSIPTIQFLNEVVPGCQIDWVVEKGGASLVTAHPLVHKPMIIDTKRWRKNPFSPSTWQEVRAFIKTLRSMHYDLIFDFQGNIKSGLITSFAKGSVRIGFGKKSAPERLNRLFTTLQFDPPSGLNVRRDYLFLVEAWSGKKAGELKATRLRITQEEQETLHRLIQRKSSKQNIMVCPGSLWPNKQLTSATLLALLQKMQPNTKFWLVYGSDAEKLLVVALQKQLKDAELVDKLSLPLLQHWMGEMDKVIAMDSLPLHLAAEAGAMTFSVFGASSSAKYQPLGAGHIAYQGACPYGQKFEKRCPILRSCPTGACIHDLSCDDLAKRFLQG